MKLFNSNLVMIFWILTTCHLRTTCHILRQSVSNLFVPCRRIIWRQSQLPAISVACERYVAPKLRSGWWFQPLWKILDRNFFGQSPLLMCGLADWCFTPGWKGTDLKFASGGKIVRRLCDRVCWLEIWHRSARHLLDASPYTSFHTSWIVFWSLWSRKICPKSPNVSSLWTVTEKWCPMISTHGRVVMFVMLVDKSSATAPSWNPHVPI